MGDFPLAYKIIPSVSWAYLSSLLMIALYFKFNRLWSVRNLDLLLIILLAPGLLTVVAGATQREEIGEEIRIARAESEDIQAEQSAGESDAKSGDEGVEVEDQTENIRQEAKTEQSTKDEQQAGGTQATPDREPPVDEQPAKQIADTKFTVSPQLKARYLSALSMERWGYILLFVAAGLFAIRMMIDPMMVRRPMLEPNMSFGGLTFLGASLLLFLTINVIASKTTDEDRYAAKAAKDLIERRANEETGETRVTDGPGWAPIYVLPTLVTFAVDSTQEDAPLSDSQTSEVFIAKLMAISCQLAIVGGLFYIGYKHFDNARMGVGIAVLYLMLPYTAEVTGQVVHILPAALLIWAVAFYRRPWVSGIFMGVAMGVFYYPLFLLPLWVSFYWKRGRWRFLSGVSTMLAVLAFSLIFTTTDAANFWDRFTHMFGIFTPRMDGLTGIWGLGWDPIYRLPILASFVVISIAFALWPAQKNLGTLICCSCALMAIVQFWHGDNGGLLMGWYLPLGLLAIFRPNLEDRVALSALKKRRVKRKGNGSVDIRPAA